MSVNITPHTYQIDDIEFSHQGANLTASTDFEFLQGDFDFDIANFTVDAGKKGSFKLGGLSVTSTFATIDDVMVIDQSDGLLKNIAFNAQDQGLSYEANDISTTSSVSFVDQKLSINADFTVNSVTVNNPDANYTLKDSVIEFSLDDIDQQAYLELEQISRQLNPEPQQMTEVLMALVSAGGKGNISKFNFNINDVQFDSSAQFSLAPYQGTAITDELNQHVAQNLQLKSQLNLSNNYGQIFAQFKPMIEHFIQSGYAAVDSEGNVSSKLSFENGQLTANDTAISM
ncbi:MAG: DUF945 family protein [Gammaproteobacteria bacterium]|nr:DUF945 family protein [Gammaproteobacteria bacterium]